MNLVLRAGISSIAVAMLVGAPFSAGAATFISDETKQTIRVTQEVSDDLYVAGGSVEVVQPVAQDAFAVGQNITVSAAVGQDLYTAGQNLTVSGAVGDDVHMAGAVITFSGTANGDLFAAGQSLQIGSDAIVNEDVYVAGETVTISGTVHGDVRASANRVYITSTAVIDGDVITESGQQPDIEEGATIGGELRHTATAPVTRERSDVLGGWVRQVLSQFVLAAVLLYVFPAFTKRVLHIWRTTPGPAALVGLLWLILFLPVSILLAVTVIGLPFTFLVLVLSAAAYIVGQGMAALVIGQWVFAKIGQKSEPQPATPASELAAELTWAAALLGAVLYQSVQLLTGIGVLVAFLFTLAVAGAVVLTAWRGLRE